MGKCSSLPVIMILVPQEYFYSKERAKRFDEMLSMRLDQGGTFTGDNTPVVHVLEEGNSRVMLIALDTNLETNHRLRLRSCW